MTDEAKIKNSSLTPFFLVIILRLSSRPLVILTMIYITTDELHITYLTLLVSQSFSEDITLEFRSKKFPEWNDHNNPRLPVVSVTVQSAMSWLARTCSGRAGISVSGDLCERERGRLSYRCAELS